MKISDRPIKKRRIRDCQGVTLVLVTIFIVALFAFAALSLDLGNVLREQRKAHAGTDAGALAGILELPNASAAIDMARVVANANGIKDAEIADGARNGYPGAIQVGRWDEGNRVFVPDLSPYNAIRVPARRSVLLNFAKVIGLGTMSPAVDSVAIVGKLVTAYGVPSNVVASANIGDIVDLHWWTNPTGGNWGMLNLCSTLTGRGDTEAALASDGCFATIGQVVSVATGFDGIRSGFEIRFNSDPIVIMPVTTSFPTGNHEVTIVDFVEVKLQSGGTGGGSGFTLPVEIRAKGVNPNPRRALVE